jgi:hypothetical protein
MEESVEGIRDFSQTTVKHSKPVHLKLPTAARSKTCHPAASTRHSEREPHGFVM